MTAAATTMMAAVPAAANFTFHETGPSGPVSSNFGFFIIHYKKDIGCNSWKIKIIKT